MKRPLIMMLFLAALLHAQSPGHVTGRVTGQRGQPVRAEISVIAAGAGIRMSTSFTDDRGGFAIDVPTGNVVLLARADGYVSEQQNIGVRPGRGNVPVHFSLSQSGSVLGQVIDTNGSPVAGARVWLVYRGEARSWRLGEESGDEPTDAYGNFTVPVVAQDRPFMLLAESDEYLLSSSGTMILRGKEMPGVLLLLSRRGTTISGRVVDSFRQPVSGAEVQLRSDPADTEFTTEQRNSLAFARKMHKKIVSGPDGLYAFTGVPSGRVVVSASERGRRGAAEATTSDGQPLTIDLVLSQ
jgi:protocatechuate 3,4-dioxygenase beta subunit